MICKNSLRKIRKEVNLNKYMPINEQHCGLQYNAVKYFSMFPHYPSFIGIYLLNFTSFLIYQREF